MVRILASLLTSRILHILKSKDNSPLICFFITIRQYINLKNFLSRHFYRLKKYIIANIINIDRKNSNFSFKVVFLIVKIIFVFFNFISFFIFLYCNEINISFYFIQLVLISTIFGFVFPVTLSFLL